MPYIVTVAFARPTSGTFNFNMEYYLNNHTTLAIKAFRPLGLQSLTVVDYREDASQPYVVTNVMEWDSVEEFQKQQGSESVQSVFADLVNVTDMQPIFLQGEAKGNVGANVLNALIDSQFSVTVLTRKSGSFPAGVEVKVVDYNSLESLKAAVNGQDAVIDTTQSDDSETPVRLIEASAAVGVYRFITSDFGFDPELPGVHDLPVFGRKKASYQAVKAKARETEMTYTVITPGAFLDWNLATGFAGIDLKKKSATMFDKGDNVMVLTTLKDIGRAAANALLKPNETRNRPVYIHNVFMTQRQLLDVAKEALGSDGWEESSQDMTVAFDKAMSDLKAGDITPMTFGVQIQYALAKKELMHPWDKDDNALVGAKEMTRDEVKQLIREIAA